MAGSTPSYLGQRQAALRAAQNGDGGWGYFRAKVSRLEPTVYAAMVLAGEPAADRGWNLLKSWQNADGGWRTAAQVSESGWGTALCVTLGLARGERDVSERGVKWLVETSGAESKWLSILAARLRGDRDYSLKAWPWRAGNSGWVEPTSHALVALKKSGLRTTELSERVRMGEAQLMDVRSADGGWNYGSKEALGQGLSSYPETTALALVGLQGHLNLEAAFTLAEKQLQETPSPLGRAWLTVAARLHQAKPPELAGTVGLDVMVTAIEALADADGNFHFMKTGAAHE